MHSSDNMKMDQANSTSPSPSLTLQGHEYRGRVLRVDELMLAWDRLLVAAAARERAMLDASPGSLGAVDPPQLLEAYEFFLRLVFPRASYATRAPNPVKLLLAQPGPDLRQQVAALFLAQVDHVLGRGAAVPASQIFARHTTAKAN